jgi:PHD/YefM family antitoxin component YafN of YafNO toxin-antitoxin module
VKSVDLRSETIDLSQLLQMAEEDVVLVVTPNGHEFILAEADDFEAEAETLRQSARFQAFLDRRTAEKSRIPIEDIEKEIAQELERS